MTSFAPEVIVRVGSFPVTNTVIDTILVDGVLLLIAFLAVRKLTLIPGLFQNAVEFVVEGLNNFTEGIAQERTKRFFPYFITFFLFILIANWTGLIPGITSVGITETVVSEHGAETEIVPLIRPLTSDLNATLGLAIISLVATHVLAIKILGFDEYISRFLPFVPWLISLLKGKPKKIKIDTSSPMNMFLGLFTPLVFIFVGFLEIISEFVKVVSLSFRLFGNIYAGEVVLHTVSGIFAFIFPIPFMTLEIVVGLVQGLVFAMLTLAFMVIVSTPHHEESKEVKAHGV